MPQAVIRSNRTEVSSRFPLLGFTVRTGANPYFEVAMATDPSLFSDRAHRTANTFYSTRALGPLPADGEEAIYLVPDDVLRRFVGHDRIYYAVATFADRNRSKPQVAVISPDAAPYVSISRSFTGRLLRQMVGGSRSGGGEASYGAGNGASLEWAGDAARPGTEQASPSSTPTASTIRNDASTPAAQASSLAADDDYDDGYSRDLWASRLKAGGTAGADFVGASARSFDIGWSDVEVVPQTNDFTCWAAAAAMLVGWRDRISIDPAQIAAGAGPWAKYTAGLRLTDIARFADAWVLEAEHPQSYSIDSFRELVESRGPLWVAALVPGLHAIVVTGIYGNGSPDGTYVRINDPWGRMSGSPGAPGTYNPTPGRGSQYVLTFRQFAAEYEGAGGLPGAAVQILHARESDMSGRTPLVTSQAFAVWQTIDSGRSPARARTQAVPAIVPIATTIAGLVMTRISNNVGDIHWELDQGEGLRHPHGDPANAGTGAYSTTTTKVEGWPAVENQLGDRICADFEMEWQYNGRSLGNIVISNITTNDAVGWGLDVKATIMGDAETHGDIAGIRVRFEYHFTRSIGSDIIAITDYTLLGDGTYTRRCKWTQGGSAEAQSLAAGSPGRNGGAVRSQAMVAPAVVPIAAAVVGTVMTRVLNNEGDVKWELDQMRGMKHVGDDPANVGSLSPTWNTITVKDWPEVTNGLGDSIYANFEIRFQYDGRSLGNISITNINTNDAVGWGLNVKAQIMDDAAAYTLTSGPAGAPSFAAVKIQFYYRFDRSIGSDAIAIADYTLYGNGTYSSSGRWTQ